MPLIDLGSAKTLKPIILKNTDSLKSIKEVYETQESQKISYLEIKIVQAMVEKGDL